MQRVITENMVSIKLMNPELQRIILILYCMIEERVKLKAT